MENVEEKLTEVMTFSCKYKILRNTILMEFRKLQVFKMNKCKVSENAKGECRIHMLNDRKELVYRFDLANLIKVYSGRINEQTVSLQFKEKPNDTLSLIFFNTTTEILSSFINYLIKKINVNAKPLVEPVAQGSTFRSRAAMNTNNRPQSALEKLHAKQQQASKLKRPQIRTKQVNWSVLDDFALFGILKFLTNNERLRFSTLNKRTWLISNMVVEFLAFKYDTSNEMIVKLLRRFEYLDGVKFNGRITNNLLKGMTLNNLIEIDLSP